MIILFIFTFDDTMFPRSRFTDPMHGRLSRSSDADKEFKLETEGEDKQDSVVRGMNSNSVGDGEDMPPRTYRQQIAIVHYFADDQTTWFQYFRRPFYLFAFPNIVLAGIQFAFGCTAGIVSFNTISEIMTEKPYNWSAGSTGLLFLAALIGNFLGYVSLLSFVWFLFLF